MLQPTLLLISLPWAICSSLKCLKNIRNLWCYLPWVEWQRLVITSTQSNHRTLNSMELQIIFAVKCISNMRFCVHREAASKKQFASTSKLYKRTQNPNWNQHFVAQALSHFLLGTQDESHNQNSIGQICVAPMLMHFGLRFGFSFVSTSCRDNAAVIAAVKLYFSLEFIREKCFRTYLGIYQKQQSTWTKPRKED